ncbi:DUF1993 domain-containing protein, partial [Ralstonia pseudosolanacearum]|uniref:DUF1993 domain-containing protein n=1 Tax=Ralstonia pseudosolanacearum TaxID=1310165 RepID=UPI003CFAA998
MTKGHKYALSNGIDPETFVTASIHPDMKDFRFQVYVFTNVIKAVPSRLNPALQPMPLPDDQKTFEELLARIEKTIEYLEGFKESDFEVKEQEVIVLEFPGKRIKFQPMEYVAKWVQPSMWFHIVTAYNILRMKGVDVGKLDYLNGAEQITVEEA